MKLRNSLLGILIFAAGSASGVSKVGGGTLSNETIGLMTKYSPAYDRVWIAENQDVQFHTTNRTSPLPKFIRFHLLENEMPEWLGRSDRHEFAEHFRRFQWNHSPHGNSCVEMWSKVDGHGLTVVLSWGEGKGALLVSTTKNLNDVYFIVHSLTLDPGACGWK